MEAAWVALIASLTGAALGAYVGVRVTIASLKERLTTVEHEVQRLRDWRHDEVSQVLTRHELDIDTLKRRIAGDER